MPNTCRARLRRAELLLDPGIRQAAGLSYSVRTRVRTALPGSPRGRCMWCSASLEEFL